MDEAGQNGKEAQSSPKISQIECLDPLLLEVMNGIAWTLGL